MPRQLPKPSAFRNGWRAGVTNPRTHKRTYKTFAYDEYEKAQEWIDSMLRVFAKEKSGRLGGPANCTLVELLTEYAIKHYSRLSGGGVQDVNRVNKWRECCGLPRLRVTHIGKAFRVETVEKNKSEREQAHQNSLKEGKEEVFNIMAKLGRTLCVDLSRNDIAELIETMAAVGSASGNIDLEIAVLRGAINKAIADWDWEGFKNPAEGHKTGRSKVVSPILDQSKLRSFVKVAYQSKQAMAGPAIEFAFETLLRKGSLLALTWGDIDFDARYCRVKVKKSKLKGEETTKIPLSRRALRILKALPGYELRNLSSKVFDGLTVAKLDKAFDKVRVQVGVKDWRFHDLRHFGATYLARNSMNAYKLQKMLGHKTIHMAVRYVNLEAQDVCEFLDSNVQELVLWIDDPDDIDILTTKPEGFDLQAETPLAA